MKNNHIYCLIICMLAGLTILSTDIHAKAIGLVIAVEGKVSAVKEGDAPRALAMKSEVFLNDKITTATESKLQIMFNDDSVISQGEKSEMVLDKYVFDPDGAKEEEPNSSMRLIKGVFRVVTGKITEMNPDRFKVQTRMATIGVRGCELGFRVSSKKENVYILWLPKGKSIAIEKKELGDELAAGDFASSDNMLNIIESGVAVTIEKGAGLSSRELLASEAKDLVTDSTPKSTSSAIDSDDSGSGGGGAKAAFQALNDAAASSNEESNEDSQFANVETSSHPPLPSGPTEDPPDNMTPTKATPATSSGGSSPASTWWWEVLTDGTVDFGLASGKTDLDAADLADIANTSSSYNLTGTGDAGAVLSDGGVDATVQGTVAMDVTIGGPSPSWTADIRMSTGTSHLNFDASGTVESDGELDGSIDEGSFSYSMQVEGGTVHGSSGISDDSVMGQLFGVGITGCAGDYHFNHGSGTRADGAFGADLM